MMFLSLITFVVLMIVVKHGYSDPSKPEMPGQFTVKDIKTEVFTNAGAPPHYVETDKAQYYDITAKKQRYDVQETSSGMKGPYSIIKDFSVQYPVQCGNQGTYQASRGYLIQDGACCYTSLIQDCPAAPGYFPTPDTMFVPTLPAMAKYDGVVSGSPIVANGADADLWESVVMLKQSVPFMTQDFYFDSNDHKTQLANGVYVYVEGSHQFINATVTYEGGPSSWTIGAPEASVFDYSGYDCSMQCKSSQSEQMRLSVDSRMNKFKPQGAPAAVSKSDVKGSSCDAITDDGTCLSSMEGGEACAWCEQSATAAACFKRSDTEDLAPKFSCTYQAAYAAYDN